MSDYIFARNSDNELVFIGDFEGLYINDPDPWGQSATQRGEYLSSRARQLNLLSSYADSGRLLDVGCGLGYTSAYYSKSFNVTGLDVSETAILKAKDTYQNINFICHDVREFLVTTEKYDVVILNQILWYILADLKKVIEVLSKVLKKNGCILISNFIFDRYNQEFGLEFFSGHTEILGWLEKLVKDSEFIVDSYLCERLDEKYFDFHAVLINKGK